MIKIPEHKAVKIKAEFPRLYISLELFWGSNDFNEFISNLLLNPADKIQREGFPHHIIKELFELQRLHMDLFKQFVKVDKWDV